MILMMTLYLDMISDLLFVLGIVFEIDTLLARCKVILWAVFFLRLQNRVLLQLVMHPYMIASEPYASSSRKLLPLRCHWSLSLGLSSVFGFIILMSHSLQASSLCPVPIHSIPITFHYPGLVPSWETTPFLKSHHPLKVCVSQHQGLRFWTRRFKREVLRTERSVKEIDRRWLGIDGSHGAAAAEAAAQG